MAEARLTKISPTHLKGHSRPVTKCKFNRQGDILITTAKDTLPCLWNTETCERIGTYGVEVSLNLKNKEKEQHTGAVRDCDLSFDTDRLLTAGADERVFMWDVKRGEVIWKRSFGACVSACAFSTGDRMALVSVDGVPDKPAEICLYNLPPKDREQVEEEPVSRRLVEENMLSQKHAVWGHLNVSIYSAGEDGIVRMWDVESGFQISHVAAHKKEIMDMQLNKHKALLLTSSLDFTAKLWDVRSSQKCIDVFQCKGNEENPCRGSRSKMDWTHSPVAGFEMPLCAKCQQPMKRMPDLQKVSDFELVKEYKADRPIRSAAFNPVKKQIIMAGGQDAKDVTTTASSAGKFDILFMDCVHEEQLATVNAGHFGTIHTLAFSPDGSKFASGGEDGLVILYKFDKSYYAPDEKPSAGPAASSNGSYRN